MPFLILNSSYYRHDIISPFTFYNIYKETVNLVIAFLFLKEIVKNRLVGETFECQP